MGFWRGAGIIGIVFGLLTFGGSLILALTGYDHQGTAAGEGLEALGGLGMLIGIIVLIVSWALYASDKPQPPVVVNQYQQQRMSANRVPAYAPPMQYVPVNPQSQQMSQPANYCPGCGRLAPRDGTFCPNCGRRLN